MRFNLQQFCGTVAILGVWAAVILFFSAGTSHPTTLSQKAEPQLTKSQLETRDEKTGETARIHYRNEFGSETHYDVRFKDGTLGTVYYDQLGQVRKVVETRKNGSYQLFSFTRGQLTRHQSFSVDGKLLSDTYAVEKSLQTIRYTAQGRRISTQRRFSDGSLESEFYHADGVTVRARVRLESEHKGSIVTFTETGSRYSEEVFEEDPNGCMDEECGGKGTLEVKIFRPDGSLWIVQNRSTEYGSTTVTGQEFGNDGKTVLRQLNPEDMNNSSSDFVLVDVEGTVKKHIRFISSEGALVKEIVTIPGGAPKQTEFAKDKQVKVDLEIIRYQSKKDTLVPEAMQEMEPNHLKQMLSE